MFAQVLVFLPIKAQATPFFDYAVPASLAAQLRPGMMVIVPFRERRLPGIVMALTPQPAVPDPRPIEGLLDAEPVLPPALLDLARWMSAETLTPLHTCVMTMLPPGLRPKKLLRLTPLVTTLPTDLPPHARALLELLLARGPLSRDQINAALRGKDWQRAMTWLERQGLIKVERSQTLPQPQPHVVRLATLLLPREAWPAAMKGLKQTERYLAVLEFLEREAGPVELEVIRAETGVQTEQLKTLQKRGLLAFSSAELVRDPLTDKIFVPTTPPPLLPDQQQVWDTLAEALETASPVPTLLLGVTGSGKTEIYLRLTERVLAQGRQALILVPEISLTPQTVRRFMLRFPGKVGVWHSAMSEGERYDTWRRARQGDLQVLVGARSALFTPFPHLGLIVLDEEEDSSYKQSQPPMYHAREAAEKLAQLTGAQLLLGSATPSLEAYARALEGRYRLLQMPRRVLGHQQRIADWQHYLHLSQNRYRPLEEAPQACTIALPPVQLVDMRAELQAGNRSIFSRVLAESVDQALARREQVIFFLNRRGTATYVFCRDCGWVARCPKCEVPLTLHRDVESLICHHCGFQGPMASRCPQCGSGRVRAFGLGTEGLEEQVAARWPEARRLRWDRDVARTHAAHTNLLTRFATGQADILIGTQMVARGLDLPAVTVVGVISADVGLFLPDFRAAERTFQLLAQVAGRAGRGLPGGRTILQTYHPEHYAIQYAAVHDTIGFARRELAFREAAGYPPYMRLARLLFQHSDAGQAEAAARLLAKELREALQRAGLPASDLIGPAPAFFARVRGRYRWHLLLRHFDPPAFLRDFPLPPGWRVDIDPVDVL